MQELPLCSGYSINDPCRRPALLLRPAPPPAAAAAYLSGLINTNVSDTPLSETDEFSLAVISEAYKARKNGGAPKTNLAAAAAAAAAADALEAPLAGGGGANNAAVAAAQPDAWEAPHADEEAGDRVSAQALGAAAGTGVAENPLQLEAAMLANVPAGLNAMLGAAAASRQQQHCSSIALRTAPCVLVAIASSSACNQLGAGLAELR
eukprot:TRINITY_DN648_c0_g1_i1.p1 TRINITY_DN648_c0_g1~~TRINITY_DN648_c0_g1_i1.p1  ORF type:complete len:207 (+),score=51.77 TRINITY_DN648_c0_g1_i1:601-1221(+)